jgi:hypothetical protein
MSPRPNLSRLLACLLALVVAWVVSLRAAGPAIGEVGQADDVTQVATVVFGSLINDGNAVIAAVSQVGADVDQTYAFASTPSNTWTSGSYATTTGANPNRRCIIATAASVTTTAGALTVTATASAGTAAFRLQAVEVGANGLTMESVTSANLSADAADSTSHTGATSLTTQADAFIYTIMAGNATLGALTPTASPAFTELSGFATSSSKSQYYNGGTALSSNSLTWTSGTARTAASCTVALSVAAGGAPARRGTLLGILP